MIPASQIFGRPMNEIVTTPEFRTRYAATLPVWSAKEKLAMAEFKWLRQSKLSQYKRANVQYAWESIPDNLARRWHEVPNWWRKSMCPVRLCKGRDPQKTLPENVAEQFERLMSNKSIGATTVSSTKEHVSEDHMIRTMEQLVSRFNSKVETKNNENRLRNEENRCLNINTRIYVIGLGKHF